MFEGGKMMSTALACLLALSAGCQSASGGTSGGGTAAGPVCGNGYCEVGETKVSCPNDCKPATVCSPGASVDCYDCPNGAKGNRKCNADGSALGSCSCPAVNLCANRECGPNGNGGTCGTCTSGTICDINGKCVATGPGPCSASVPNGTCPTGQSCIAGSCCENPCGSACCNAGSTCVADAAGNTLCAQECANSGECPTLKSCCAKLESGKGACLSSEFQDGLICLCNSANQCETGVCGQESDTNGLPTGAKACVPADGAPYHGCAEGDTCTPGFCCVKITWPSDFSENTMCAAGCSTSAQCGAATCNMMNSGTCNSSPGICQ